MYRHWALQDMIKPNELLNDPRVSKLAVEAGKSNAQLLIKWNIQRGVPVIAKSANPDRIRQNMVRRARGRTPDHTAGAPAARGAVPLCSAA